MGFGQSIPQISVYASLEQQFEELHIAVSEAINGGHYILGGLVREFELAWSNYNGTVDCVAVASGTDAIELALRANGIGRGDEVITVGNAGVPTVNAILAAGAKPVIVDVNDELLIDWKMISGAINISTRAILPVHLYGNVCDMFNIGMLAHKYNLAIIEDCAQAHGTHGTSAYTSAWSFYPTKNLGAFGDAGAVTANSAAVIERLTKMRQYGWDNWRRSVSWGKNSRMDDIQAAVLLKKLSILDENVRRRACITKRYAQACDDFDISYVKSPVKSAHHQFVLISDDRDELEVEFCRLGIGTAVHYHLPIYEHPYYRGRVRVHSFQKTDYYCNRVLSVPSYPQLSDEQVERVCDAIKSIRSRAMPCTSRVPA